MKYFLWRLLGRRFWIKLTSHWKDKRDKYYFGEWEQRKDQVKNFTTYQLIHMGAENPKPQVFHADV